MKTKIAHIRKLKNNIDFFAEEVKQGKLFIMPTDTIYGFIASIRKFDTVERIFKIKQRDVSKKFLILVKDFDTIKEYADSDNLKQAYKKIESYSSSKPTTFIIKAKKGLPEYIVKDGRIAFRIPKKKFLLDLLKRVETPVVAPSANISGEKNIRFYMDIIKKFSGEVDYIFYKYFLWSIKPSAIIDVSSGEIKIIRK